MMISARCECSMPITALSSIPLSIKLLENPKSPIAFPGSISLKGHDYLHLLLNRGVTLFDEGFVVGFTMGNCDQLRPHHISLYKLFSKTVFPKTYKFKNIHFKAFDLGVMYGQKLPTHNIHRVDFDQYAHQKISDVRRMFGIDLKQVQMLWEKERLLLDSNS